jgi:hypothetical protein
MACGLVAGATLAGGITAPATSRAAQPAPGRHALCASVEQSRADAALALSPGGEETRAELLRLAASGDTADALCGIAGLAALRDAGALPAVRAALGRPALRDDAFRVARFAAYLAGGPDPDRGAAFLPLVEAFEDPATWTAAGLDAAGLLGVIDHPRARARLVLELDRPMTDAALDAVIVALSRQGEPRVQARVSALGEEAVATRSGNTTYEQARRMGAVAFYLMALGPDTMSDGLAMLRQLALADQEDTAAWAVQTWCERATRRPAEQASADRARLALADELGRMNVRWKHLRRGMFPCTATP